MVYRIPITDIHIQGQQWKAIKHLGYLEITASGNGLLIKIAELEGFQDEHEKYVDIDIIVEDELLHFKGPHPNQKSPIFSYKFGVSRPTTWITAIFPHENPENVAVFTCDVLCDMADMNTEQKEQLAKALPEISAVPVATLSSDAITQYLDVSGVTLWQETADLWSMLENDLRCYEKCLRPVYTRMKELSPFIAQHVHLWDPAHISAISSVPLTPNGRVVQQSFLKVRDTIQGVDVRQTTCHFLPLLDQDAWSLFVVANTTSNMTPTRGEQEVIYCRFLMHGVTGTDTESIMSKFLQVFMGRARTVKFEIKTIQLPEDRFSTSGFLVAKLFKWVMENEEELQQVLVNCKIPAHVFQ